LVSSFVVEAVRRVPIDASLLGRSPRFATALELAIQSGSTLDHLLVIRAIAMPVTRIGKR